MYKAKVYKWLHPHKDLSCNNEAMTPLAWLWIVGVWLMRVIAILGVDVTMFEDNKTVDHMI